MSTRPMRPWVYEFSEKLPATPAEKTWSIFWKKNEVNATIWHKATFSALLQKGGLIDFVYKVPYRVGTVVFNNLHVLAGLGGMGVEKLSLL